MSTRTPGTRTRVGKYELGKTLGEGNFAKVKFAKNVENGDFVAIKILNRDKVLQHKMVEQVNRILFPLFIRMYYDFTNSILFLGLIFYIPK